MNEHKTYDLLITFCDGTHQRFRFPAQVDKLKMNHFIERLLTTPTLSLQLDDRLIMIPTASIRSAELYPAPRKLPELVLHQVECASEVS